MSQIRESCMSSFCQYSSVSDDKRSSKQTKVRQKTNFIDGPSLQHFIANSTPSSSTSASDTAPAPGHREQKTGAENVPYLSEDSFNGNQRKVYFETYGCQMNVSDTEIAWSILKENGFLRTTEIKESDVVLVMTCAVRDGAEQKIWNRLEYLKSLKKNRSKHKTPFNIGILGCMAERLKKKLLEREEMVDLVCGPDAYRDLPRMLALTQSGQTAVNVLLSLEETYADVRPVRMIANSVSAFVSIMRGCDNMCSYCIVPFTRGRERSRPIDSILDEVRALSDQGVKEVTLLGQNVNSYRDKSELSFPGGVEKNETSDLSQGFRTVYKPRMGGRRFDDLLERVSLIDPDMRIRFTSPHPKDFPDGVLQVIHDRVNICRSIHLPAQSGSSRVLEAMRRGYTSNTYLALVEHIRDILPDVSLSSDFIAGFCGETESDHQESLSLLRRVRYSFAYCFPYSMREKTRAHHKLVDDVPGDLKSRRHMELTDTFRDIALEMNNNQIGQHHLVLIEGPSKRCAEDWAGRNEFNTRVIVHNSVNAQVNNEGTTKPLCIKPGDYVVVQITSATSQVLRGLPLRHTSLQECYTNQAIHKNHRASLTTP
ncbi:CDK5 regulatory subunit-associated protein 1 [Lamellibrachia satsuma]|nr:CDK5 regulatory subunit-associated protein 1 [Lamellibrachia satsuma]